MRTAIIPGSFDPMTLGHRDLVERALKLFDSVVVAIMVNPDKNGRFSFLQRKRIAELTLAGLPRVSVVTSEGYLADLAAELGAVAIVKGIRNTEDYLYENKMAVFNHERNPMAETVYLPAYGSNAEISSTEARRSLASGGTFEGLLSPAVAEYIKELTNDENNRILL